jgi:hypothetical protein
MPTFKEKLKKMAGKLKEINSVSNEIKNTGYEKKAMDMQRNKMIKSTDKKIVSDINKANKISNPLKKHAEKTRQITKLADYRRRTKSSR